jgi:hypothetical protein
MSPNWGRSVTVQASTVGDVGPESDRSLAKRRALYAVSTTVVTLVMVLGVVDAFGWFNVFGVDSARVEASGGGYRLDVQYTAVSRPALASPFEITVSREGGFDGPVTIGVTRTYLQIWDENGLFPAPSAETVNGEWLQWEFDPPVGDELIVYYDARIEPAQQSGRGGAVAVFEDDVPVVEVDFYTEVRP